MKKIIVCLAFILCIGTVCIGTVCIGTALAAEIVSFGQQTEQTVVIANTSRELAVAAISQAEQDIAEMKIDKLPAQHQEDLLLEAKKALERADYARVLKTGNHTDPLLNEAVRTLEGLDWQGFTYTDVIKYTDEISSRKEQAYALSDALALLDLKLRDFKAKGSTISENSDMITGYATANAKFDSLYFAAENAFKEERYTDARALIENSNLKMDEVQAENTAIKTVARASKTFIENNSWKFLIGVLLCSLVAISGHKAYSFIRAQNKLQYLKSEKRALVSLMQKAQRERFEQGTMPDSMYRIQMNKYQSKLARVRKELPILEGLLGKSKQKPRKFKLRR